MEEILRLFPAELKSRIRFTIANQWDTLQEIRLRVGQPIELVFDHQVTWVKAGVPTQRDCIFILSQMSEFSLYRMEDELREGYMTIEGGHRVGLAGKVNTLGGHVKAVHHVTFLNIRIAKEKMGVALPIMPYIYERDYMNTLFVGPPQTGKTTLIRDVSRLIATGWRDISARKVGVVDERSEIGASIKGIPQHNVGLRTDVMDACPKAEGMMMLIRSMSPEVIIVDEIGSSHDVEALMEAIHAGVVVICTIHGQTVEELKSRPSLQSIFSQKVFKRIVLLDRGFKPGHIKKIYNEKGANIFTKSRGSEYEVDWGTSFLKHNNMDWI